MAKQPSSLLLKPRSAGTGKRRRHVLRTLGGLLAAPSLAGVSAAQQVADPEALIRAGGVVVAFRHALAPGTFDPPGFRLGDCSTQRNLSDEGRAQARRIGDWFRQRSLVPAAVLSSPWCRCIDTATLAFGPAQVLPALGSPRGVPEGTRPASLAELRRRIQAAAARRGRFEVWVTHMFVLSDLLGEGSGSGEGLVLGVAADAGVRVLARLAPPG
jgi:phosphohistidine phosphatase SixA